MKIIYAAIITGAVALLPAAASADDRALNTALGAGAGAIVGGPVGAVAGGTIGFVAGKDISRAIGTETRPRKKRTVKRYRTRHAERY